MNRWWRRYSRCLMGVALGIVMRVGSPPRHRHREPGTQPRDPRPVSVFVYITDIVIVGLQVLVATSEQILLGIIVIVLETLVLDRAMLLGKSASRSSPLRIV